jgi:hypothetical protein
MKTVNELLSDNLVVYDHMFDQDTFIKIINILQEPKWEFGHTSYHPSDPNHKRCYKFWKRDLSDNLFFTDYLLNKIQEKTQQSFTLEYVYANGHTYGLDGIFHQDCYDEYGRTFLLCANSQWANEWGGGTQFYTDTTELRTVMFQPNRGMLFPGVVYHSAAPTTRLFNDLRITVAWKLTKNE